MWLVGEGFGRRIARERARDLLPLCGVWQPDVIVCEEVDFGAMIVAERLSIPYASVLVIAAGSFVRPEIVRAPLSSVRNQHGLPEDPELEMLRRHLVLSPFPSSFRDPAFPLPATARSVRLPPRDAGDAPPPWLAELDDAPTVYFTLGTIYNLECGDLFQRVLSGLRDLPINLIVTVGRDIDPTELGPQPDNVHVERFVPQASLLPHCDLVVCHGGSGSVTNALADGLPMVVIPLGADQPLNGARCRDLGVARVLEALTLTPPEVGATVSDVLETPSYRLAAEPLRAEIEAMPGPEFGVGLLERLVRD
jgi:UDP:flavonoid glycosyltransferase YjiC (YdhE family)